MKIKYALLATLFFPTVLCAQQPLDTIWHTKKAHIDVVVNSGGTYVQSMEIANVVLNQQAINALGTTHIGYSASLQEAEIVDAATIKASGERIPVAKSAILTQDAPGPQNVTVLQDFKFKTIVFPRLEVGDSIYYKAKITQKTPIFPGQFSFLQLFPKNVIWDDARVTVSAPKSYPLDVKAIDVSGGTAADSGDTRTWTWTHKSSQAQAIEPGTVSLGLHSPRVMVSSFRDYGALAAAYQARAQDKAKRTPAIQSLADELTKGAADQKEQVKRLYDWVAHNIRYVAIHLDIGGFVPHPAEEVLAIRYGDCKDHVVLLEALLAAKGIASTPALIDLRPNYALPEVATPQAFNHVITYIPSLDLYLDSTNPYAPFGVLPMENTDKPVIHTAAYDGIKRTPPSTSDNASISKTTLVFNKDGGLAGDIKIESKGPVAILMRGMANSIPPGREGEFVHHFLGQNGIAGAQGSLQKTDDSNTGINTFAIQYRSGNAQNVSAPGALTISPPFTTPFSLSNTMHSMALQERKHPYLCAARTVEENFEVTLPGNLKIVAIPKGLTSEMEDASYRSTYRLEGNSLIVTRQLVSRIKGNVCEPSRYKEQYEMAQAIVADLKSQVLYQPE